MTAPWRTAWITGASAGIGRALALNLGKRGVKVAASARSLDKLAEVAELDTNITPFPLDVADLGATKETVRSIAASLGPIDLAVLNAGVWEAMSSRNFSADKAGHSMAVNYLGVANGLEARCRPCASGAAAISPWSPRWPATVAFRRWSPPTAH